jgi:hypothetical protein
MIHMTATVTLPSGGVDVGCRCPWREGPFPTREAARLAGDAHLAEANGGSA